MNNRNTMFYDTPFSSIKCVEMKLDTNFVSQRFLHTKPKNHEQQQIVTIKSVLKNTKGLKIGQH